MRREIAAGLVLALLAGTAPAQTFEDARAALDRADYATALTLLAPLAEAGDARAMFELGILHDEGLGVPTDMAEAARWFSRAAEAGDRLAQFALADMYLHGEGVEYDPWQAASWFLAAAQQGDVDAQFMLGLIHGGGEGLPENPVMSYFWYVRAAAQGDGEAAENLADLSARMDPEARAKAEALLGR